MRSVAPAQPNSPRTARSRSSSRSTMEMTLSSKRSASEFFNSLLELHEERSPLLGSRNGRRVTGTWLRHHPEPRWWRCPVRGRLQRHNASREKTVLTVAHLEDDARALQRAALGPTLNRHPFTHASLLCWSSRSD